VTELRLKYFGTVTEQWQQIGSRHKSDREGVYNSLGELLRETQRLGHDPYGSGPYKLVKVEHEKCPECGEPVGREKTELIYDGQEFIK